MSEEMPKIFLYDYSRGAEEKVMLQIELDKKRLEIDEVKLKVRILENILKAQETILSRTLSRSITIREVEIAKELLQSVHIHI
jgi:hypothetical protein